MLIEIISGTISLIIFGGLVWYFVRKKLKSEKDKIEKDLTEGKITFQDKNKLIEQYKEVQDDRRIEYGDEEDTGFGEDSFYSTRGIGEPEGTRISKTRGSLSSDDSKSIKDTEQQYSSSSNQDRRDTRKEIRLD